MAAEITQLLEDIKGDWQGRVRITVNETSGNDQLGLLWSWRCRHYSDAATAALAYEAEDLEPLDSAAVAALAGASGGDVVQHTNLGTNWTPVLGTNVGGSDFLTHTGSYQARARVRSPSGSAVKLRFVYDVGDLTLPEENAAWEFPAADQFYLADLGQIRLDKVPTGDHRWQGQIQAKGTVGGEDVQIDRLYFQPLDDGAGKLVAPLTVSDGLVDYSARDEFNQTAGALTGKTLPVGGTWAGAGDTTDFDVGSGVLTRTALSDADLNTGRLAIAGSTNYAAITIQCEFSTTDIDFDRGQNLFGLLARYTDVSNWLFAGLNLDGDSTGPALTIRKRLAGTTTTIAQRYGIPWTGGTTYVLRLLVDAAGRYALWYFPAEAAPGEAVVVGSDANLASGTLASGKPGLYDAYTDSLALTRSYDNFSAVVAVGDAVLFANQSAELRTEGMVRQDAAGAASGPVSQVIGDLPRLPPSGMEGRPVELFVLTSRGDLDQLPDSAIDTVAGTVRYNPSFLFAPSG